jgi:transmembrane sensor
MEQDIRWDLFQKLFNKSIADSENKELQQWRNASELHQTIYDEILDDKELQNVVVSGKWSDPDIEWNNFLPLLKPEKSKFSVSYRTLYTWAAAAAVILLFIGIGSSLLFQKLFNGDKLSADSYTYIFSPRGQRTRVVLPDKTKVWLNSETSLKYPANFNQTSREVTIEGEAFFEVEKNPKKPFLVNASEIKLKVYGTSFNVKAYPGESDIEATLVEGKLSITTPDPKTNNRDDKEIFLKPKEKFIFTKAIRETSKPLADNTSQAQPEDKPAGQVKPATILVPETISIKNDDAVKEVSWKDGKLIFKEETFENLAIRLERWYDVKIHFTNEKIKQYRFTGSFDRETVNQAMEALKISSVQSYQYQMVFRDIYLR